MLGDKLYAVGFHRQSILTVQEIKAIEDLWKCKIVSENVKLYFRFIFKGCIFHTRDYSENYKIMTVTLPYWIAKAVSRSLHFCLLLLSMKKNS